MLSIWFKRNIEWCGLSPIDRTVKKYYLIRISCQLSVYVWYTYIQLGEREFSSYFVSQAFGSF